MNHSRIGFFIFFVISLGLLILNMTIGRPTDNHNHELTINDDFARLLGKETAAWRHIRGAEDGSMVDRYAELYERHKHLQFDAAPNFKIPKIIHVIWLGPQHFPIESIENLRAWVAHHPGWTIKFWTDRDRPCPVHAMEKCYVDDFTFTKLKKHYDKARNWEEKSEILRYELLLQEGGVYIDHDVICLRPFHALHAAYDFYSCLEMPHEPIDHFALTSGTAILGAKSDHPVIQATIDFIAENLNKYRETSAKGSTDGMLLSAPRTYIALTHALQSHLDMPGNTDIVFPSSYFLAKENLPSFYCHHIRKSIWKYARTTHLEEVFAAYVIHHQSMVRRLLAMQSVAITLLVTSFCLCFRRRPSS